MTTVSAGTEALLNGTTVGAAFRRLPGDLDLAPGVRAGLYVRTRSFAPGEAEAFCDLLRAAHPDWTLDDALAHPGVGRVVRGFAAQIERDAKTVERHQQRARRYGQAVQHNGYGYAPVPAPTTTARRGKR